MSYDLKGRAPCNEAGKYFGLSAWDWNPLVEYLWNLAPTLIVRSENEQGERPSGSYKNYLAGLTRCYVGGGPVCDAKLYGWYTNDGYGLNDTDSRSLADILQTELSTNRTEIYSKRYAGDLELLADIPCNICDGIGTRDAPPVPPLAIMAERILFGSTRDRSQARIVCNICDGRGVRRPHACTYRFDTDIVRRFAAFARASGGFSIF